MWLLDSTIRTRQLLNTSVNAILHLTDKQLTLYQGNYDTFDSVRRAKLAEQESMARKQEATREHLQSFVDRFRAKASKAKQAQSRIKMLEKMEPIAAGVENSVAAFDFPTPEELSPPILRLEDTSVGYDEKPILRVAQSLPETARAAPWPSVRPPSLAPGSSAAG